MIFYRKSIVPYTIMGLCFFCVNLFLVISKDGYTTPIKRRQIASFLQFFIILSEKYHAIAASRHEEIRSGVDPFRKVERELTEKNSRVERLPKQVYEVPKKTLQLEVRRVARELGRLPTRAEMIQYGTYPIKYYDEYFVSWGEVCAAARHDGMSEERQAEAENGSVVSQPSLFRLEELDAKK